MWKKTVFVLFRFTREYSGSQKHGKHLNVVLRFLYCRLVSASFHTIEGGCSLKVSEASL